MIGPIVDSAGLLLVAMVERMLKNSRLQAIICTADLGRAERFYSGLLGLDLIGRSQGALVYRIGGTELRVSPVPDLTPSEHTVVGFAVDDLDSILDEITSKGIELELFPNFPHDRRGILNIPGGDRVAWFRDPDGNLLSVVQYSA